jgi:hypothetical protein
MIVLLAVLAATVLLGGPAMPMAARSVKQQRVAAAARRKEERERQQREAEEAREERERIWRDEPGNAVLRERLTFQARAGDRLNHAIREAKLKVDQIDGAIQRHEGDFRKGPGGRPGLAYQIVVLTLLGVAVAVFVLGAILDFLIFRGLHPGGSVLIPVGLSGVVIIAVMVGSFLAISAQRHGLIPASWNEYFTLFARLFGAALAVSAVACMIYYAPARSYLADQGNIAKDQALVAQLTHAVAPDAAAQQASAAALQAAKDQLASDETTLHKAQLLDRVSAGVLGALEIPLTEVAILGGQLIAFRILLRRREEARQEHDDAATVRVQAEDQFVATMYTTLTRFGHDHRAYGEGLTRLRDLNAIIRRHQPQPGGNPGGLGAGGGPSGPTPSGPGGGPYSGPGGPGAGGGTPVNPVPPPSPSGAGSAATAPAPSVGQPTRPYTVAGTVVSSTSTPTSPGPGPTSPTTANPTVPLGPAVPQGTVVPAQSPAPVVTVPSGAVTTLSASQFDETE